MGCSKSRKFIAIAGLIGLLSLAGCAAEPAQEQAYAEAYKIETEKPAETIAEQSIPEILEQHAALLLTDPSAVPLPKYYSIFHIVTGDLTVNGTDDIAVAIERCPGDWSEERTLYILLNQADAGYKVYWHGGHLGGRGEGGVWGDSFAGITISDGLLTTSVFGGSSDRWGTNKSFKIVSSELILYRAESFDVSTHTLGSVDSK